MQSHSPEEELEFQRLAAELEDEHRELRAEAGDASGVFAK